jgi:N6-L-threonylcarbamoyladenine synthase
VDTLASKTFAAARHFGAKQILVAGGVSANKALRAAFTGQTEFPVQIPQFSLCTDNAAMIGAAGYYRFIAGQRSGLDLDARPVWPLSSLV